MRKWSIVFPANGNGVAILIILHLGYVRLWKSFGRKNRRMKLQVLSLVNNCRKCPLICAWLLKELVGDFNGGEHNRDKKVPPARMNGWMNELLLFFHVLSLARSAGKDGPRGKRECGRC
jgi:hypothetical protein